MVWSDKHYKKKAGWGIQSGDGKMLFMKGHKRNLFWGYDIWSDSQRIGEVIHKSVWSNESLMGDSRITLKEKGEGGGGKREEEEEGEEVGKERGRKRGRKKDSKVVG